MGMEQLEFFDIPSPCVGVCVANNRGYCKGCFRSREERLYWLKFSAAQKREVIHRCQLRRRKVLQAKFASATDAKAWVFDEPELPLFELNLWPSNQQG